MPATGQVQVPYGGAALVARQRVWWAVQSFDSDGLGSGFSRPAYFEMGLLQPSDWCAAWIAALGMGSRTVASPVPLLVRDFVLASSPKRARLYLAAAGFCQGEINGEPLELGPAAPSLSDYRSRVRYRTLDVTALLSKGHNRLGLLLADGSYAGNVNRDNQRQQFGERPMLTAQLEVVSADGRVQRVVSDEQWRCRASGWLVSDRVLGEHFDARQQLPLWSRAPLTDAEQAGWLPVQTCTGPGGTLTADLAPPLVVQQRHEAVASPSLVLDEWHHPRWCYQFEQPVFGGLQIKTALGAGQRLGVDYALELPGVRAQSTDSFTGDGGALQLEPLSVLRRFSQVTLSGDLDESQLPRVSALELRCVGELGLTLTTDCQPLAQWHQALLSDLHAGCVSTPQTGQDLEVGLSATADLASVLELLGRCHSAAPLLRSWTEDLLDVEARRGNLPRVVPVVPAEPSLRDAGSTEALAQLVWSAYRHYGDVELVDRAFEAIKRLLLVMSETAADHIRWFSVPALEPQLPADLIGTAWYFHCAERVAEMAGVLGKTEEQTRFALLAEDIRRAFRRRFVTAEGAVVSRTQSALCLAVGFGLLEPSERAMAIGATAASVRQDGLRVQTGQLSLLLRILSRNGHLPLVLSQLCTAEGLARLVAHYGRTMVAAGALEWIYGDLLGLRIPEQLAQEDGAFRALVIEPCLPLGSEYVDGLGWSEVSGSCQTVRGEVASGWRLAADGLVLSLTLPADTTAQLRLPGRSPETLSAGTHERLILHSEVPNDGIPKLLDARFDSPRRQAPRSA